LLVERPATRAARSRIVVFMVLIVFELLLLELFPDREF
jgi:hypothetical protein